jgi:hypothetical protein
MTDALTAANSRIVAATTRTLYLALITAALSVASQAASVAAGPFNWTGALTGVIVLAAGFQTLTAHRQFARLAPEHARPWMTRLAYLMFLVGSLLLGAGILAGLRRFTVG